jgi:hypothetical protein
MMTFSENPAGPYWLLDHGADANLAWGMPVRGHCMSPRGDGTWRWSSVSFATAATCRSVARTAPRRTRWPSCTATSPSPAWLLAHGAKDELSPIDRFIAACARADRAAAEAILEARPSLRTELRPEHHVMLHRPAESGNAEVLETMLACGFEPDARDKDNVTPLHRAAMGGHPGAVRTLLKFGADVNARDGMFSATPLVWAVEGEATRSTPEITSWSRGH